MTVIQINEVAPRDGLQNEPATIPTSLKIDFINALSNSGLTYIEATSFVSPKWVPQLADHAEVYSSIHKKRGIRYPVLVPNLAGMKAALKCGVKDVAVFTAASDLFTQKNTNCSLEESLERASDIVSLAKKHKVSVRGYISCVFACPYAGKTDYNLVLDITRRLLELGCYEVSLGDTIGIATPEDTEEFLELLSKHISLEKIAMHFHNTQGHAIENIKRSVDLGIRSFDGSVGGLGGCPYAKGASGNVATEAIIRAVEYLGFETHVDISKLERALKIVKPFIHENHACVHFR